MKTKAFKAAFPYTLPVMAGYLFLGLAYGLYITSMGFSFWYPMLSSLIIYAGTGQFVAVSLMLGKFNPLYAFALTLMVNARHLFYGISMLDKLKTLDKKKWYMVFGMTDETFAITNFTQPPEDVDPGWFFFFITLLDHGYWFLASTLGGVLGSVIHFNTKGIDFVMTALFVTIFADQWLASREHRPALIGLGASLVCLLIFKQDQFIIPAMLLILGLLTLFRKQLENTKENALSEADTAGAGQEDSLS